MIEPCCEELEELGLLFLQKRKLKENGLKAYKASEVLSKYSSQTLLPQGGAPGERIAAGAWAVAPQLRPTGTGLFSCSKRPEPRLVLPWKGPSPPLQQSCAAGCLGWLCL